MCVAKLSKSAKLRAAALLLLLPAIVPARGETDAVTPASARMEQKVGAELPAGTRFRDQAGKEVTLADYLAPRDAKHARPVVLVFAYYRCPHLCTLVLNGLSEALQKLPLKLGADFRVLTVSIDPREKPPLALMKQRTYLAQLGLTQSDGWSFLTGEAEQIATLTAGAGFHYAWDAKAGDFAHPSGLIILTPQGKISRYLAGVQYDPRELRLALIEASERKIGSPIDRLFLSCFHYDPSTGRYSPRILAILRYFGVLFVVGMAGGFLLLTVARRRAERNARGRAA